LALDDFIISKEAVLAGSPAKRAHTLLFLIEKRTAFLVTQAQHELEEVATEEAALERNQAFLAAFSLGKEPPLKPTIQNLELYAPQWANLVPETPRLRAALANLLSQKYRFTAQSIPNIREALGLSDPAVDRAYEILYQQPLDSIFLKQVTFKDRARWFWTGFARWLDKLPPFWATVVLRVSLSLPQSFLALPIAVAGVGPLFGVGLLVVLGLINMLTIAGMAESVARSGSARYNSVFIGQLTGNFLGNVGSAMLTLAVVASFFLNLLASYMGLGNTLAGFTPVSAPFWVLLVFLAGMYLLIRKPLNFTLTLTVLLALINMGIALVLSALAVPHLKIENFAISNAPFLGGRQIEFAALSLIIGAGLTLYAGQNYTILMARMVLPRDPSAGALIKGNIVGTLVSTVFYSIWLLAVSGAIAPKDLQGQSGTALVPLAKELGVVASVLGSVMVVLMLGLTALRCMTVLVGLVEERLPKGTGKRRRFLLSIAPLFLALLLTEWFILTGAQSFAGLLSFTGVLTLSLNAGIFPVLLLVASRRKGERVPGNYWRWLANPLVVGPIYLLFLANLFIHGFIVWQGPIERSAAILTGLAVVIGTVVMRRKGAFAPRIVVEVRKETADADKEKKEAFYAVYLNGQPLSTQVILGYANGKVRGQAEGRELPSLEKLRSLRFRLSAANARELKVWLHNITPEGTSENFAARLKLEQNGEVQEIEAGSGQLILPLRQADESWLEIDLIS
jgi:amino acid permease